METKFLSSVNAVARVVLSLSQCRRDISTSHSRNRSVAVSKYFILQDKANEFTLIQFYESRELVEKALHQAVQDRLGGLCCALNCTSKNSLAFIQW